MTERRDDRSLGELLGDLGSQVTTLVRKELELARTEMTDKASAASRDAALMGVGGALLYAGLLGLMAAIVLGLIEAGLDPWIAALLVGVVVAAIGGALVARGRSGLATTDLTPKRTIETIQDDAEWVKERTP
jgi:uncharacterized membrane protein YqjE